MNENEKDKRILNLQDSIKQLKNKVAELLKEAQPKVEKILMDDKLTISLKKIDEDIFEVVIVGDSLNLKGKAIKIPTINQETLLKILYLNKS